MTYISPRLKLVACISACCVVSKAEIPQTPQLKDFSHILERSPFKIKAKPKVREIPVAPKKPVDYFLRGVTKLENGWMAILADKKDPKVNIILKQGVKSSNTELSLVDVIQDKKNYKLTQAQLKIGDEMVNVGYSLAELKQAHTRQPATSVATLNSCHPVIVEIDVSGKGVVVEYGEQGKLTPILRADQAKEISRK